MSDVLIVAASFVPLSLYMGTQALIGQKGRRQVVMMKARSARLVQPMQVEIVNQSNMISMSQIEASQREQEMR